LRIDLHLHTTASDGSLSPSALVWAARAGGLDVIAVADHDTCAGVEDARRSLPNQVHVVPAIELSTTFDGCEQHILGYFIDHKHPALCNYSEHAVQRRRERINGMLARLQPYKISMTLEEVVAAAEPGTLMIGRPHLARAMVRRGYTQTVSEAFERFIGDGGPAFLPTELSSPREAIALIHEAGGVAIWAHPRISATEKHLDTFVQWGLDGAEVFRPGASAVESQQLEEIVKRRRLLASGGSDWHGSWQGKLGDFYVSADEIGPLLERGGI
jgi:3',5'-nucleoside bisphosphate phosphatase